MSTIPNSSKHVCCRRTKGNHAPACSANCSCWICVRLATSAFHFSSSSLSSAHTAPPSARGVGRLTRGVESAAQQRCTFKVYTI